VHQRRFFEELKSHPIYRFDMFVSVTVVDWMDSAEERFEVVYHLLSLSTNARLRVRVWAPEGDAVVDSVSDLWPGADFMEREAWDMYGVVFRGHPNLRRILMYDEFKGYPLRKDYPVQGKQPRIPLRAPEVRNTAIDMKRPELVAINPRRRGTESANR
jgi:NADH-quinone oxidoreductase subunit C